MYQVLLDQKIPRTTVQLGSISALTQCSENGVSQAPSSRCPGNYDKQCSHEPTCAESRFAKYFSTLPALCAFSIKGSWDMCCATHGLLRAWIAPTRHKGMSDVPTAPHVFLCMLESCVRLLGLERMQDTRPYQLCPRPIYSPLYPLISKTRGLVSHHMILQGLCTPTPLGMALLEEAMPLSDLLRCFFFPFSWASHDHHFILPVSRLRYSTVSPYVDFATPACPLFPKSLFFPFQSPTHEPWQPLPQRHRRQRAFDSVSFCNSFDGVFPIQ